MIHLSTKHNESKSNRHGNNSIYSPCTAFLRQAGHLRLWISRTATVTSGTASILNPPAYFDAAFLPLRLDLPPLPHPPPLPPPPSSLSLSVGLLVSSAPPALASSRDNDVSVYEDGDDKGIERQRIGGDVFCSLAKEEEKLHTPHLWGFVRAAACPSRHRSPPAAAAAAPAPALAAPAPPPRVPALGICAAAAAADYDGNSSYYHQSLRASRLLLVGGRREERRRNITKRGMSTAKTLAPYAVAAVAVGASVVYLFLSRRKKKDSTMADLPDQITYDILARQDATTSNAIIDRFASSDEFARLSEIEGTAILRRDEEDGEKLQKGIDFAKEKGVIDPNFVPEPYISVDVLGKTPGEVADIILGRINEETKKGAAGGGGSVVVLCGLSGTGKGTTVTALKKKLESDGSGREVVTWSNGNIFRSVTLLAATWCEHQPDIDGFDKERALTKDNLAEFMSMLEFGKFRDGGTKYDTRIRGLGLDVLVSEVQNTDLKSPKVSKNIPTVAQVTQGEVILFAAEAIRKMGQDGMVVLLEGREQTVNYVRTPLRFVLTLSDGSLIGKRRAAQRIMAAALEHVKEGAWPGEIDLALEGGLKKMLAEVGK